MPKLVWVRKHKTEGTIETHEAATTIGARSFKVEAKHVLTYEGHWTGRLRMIEDGKTVLTRRAYGDGTLLKLEALLEAAIDELAAQP